MTIRYQPVVAATLVALSLAAPAASRAAIIQSSASLDFELQFSSVADRQAASDSTASWASHLVGSDTSSTLQPFYVNNDSGFSASQHGVDDGVAAISTTITPRAGSESTISGSLATSIDMGRIQPTPQATACWSISCYRDARAVYSGTMKLSAGQSVSFSAQYELSAANLSPAGSGVTAAPSLTYLLQPYGADVFSTGDSPGTTRLYVGPGEPAKSLTGSLAETLTNPGNTDAYFQFYAATDGWVTSGSVSAVPEPQTWALMLVGLAGITGVARRRAGGTPAATRRSPSNGQGSSTGGWSRVRMY